MPVGVLLTLRDKDGALLAGVPAVDGYCFDPADVQAPQITFSLPTDANGQLQVPTSPHFDRGDEVWVGIGQGSILDPPNWAAHFALHRVQEY